MQATNAKAKKAAAAAAASQQQQQNNSSGTGAANSAVGNNNNTNTDGNKLATASAGVAGKATGLTAPGSSLKNGVSAIKQEVTSQNPPPLHPTGGATMLQKQHAAAAGAGGAATGGQAPIPIVAQLDPNRIMPVNVS